MSENLSSTAAVIGGPYSELSAETGRGDQTMTDFEVALTDGVRTMCEVLVAKRIVSAGALSEMLRRQREAYPKDVMPGAVFVKNMLLEPLTDEARVATRKLERDPPQGSA